MIVSMKPRYGIMPAILKLISSISEKIGEQIKIANRKINLSLVPKLEQGCKDIVHYLTPRTTKWKTTPKQLKHTMMLH